MDQLVRRVDLKHRSLQQYFKEEIADTVGKFLLKFMYDQSKIEPAHSGEVATFFQGLTFSSASH